MFFVNLQRGLITDALMWAMTVILHFPQTMLVATVFRTSKTNLRKAFFVVRAITALNDAITPRTRLLDEGVNSSILFHGFGKGRFSFRMRGEFHRETHRVISESYEKGGSLSNALWYTSAMVWLV